jgi:antibiotic biosynthesis monooxygenase (ABM) superfamily enzyme
MVGYKVKAGEDILRILVQLRSSEITYPGCVSCEILENKDSAIVFTMSTWQTAAGWEAWETSKLRQSMLTQLEGLLLDTPRVTMYTIVPMDAWLKRS